jgi:hypothetical protein
MEVSWWSHSLAIARAKGREGAESVVPNGVFNNRPSRVTPYHCIPVEDEDDLGLREYFMEFFVGFSNEIFVAEFVPSTPADMGFSTERSSSTSSHGGGIGLTSTVL